MKSTINYRPRLLDALALALCWASVGCNPSTQVTPQTVSKAEAWAHGWKTKNVIATRYTNPVMGYNIGFKYPNHPNHCDRAELVNFIAEHGGHVYECGVYPGAEMLAVFRDVKDKEAANAKLTKILPALEALVASF